MKVDKSQYKCIIDLYINGQSTSQIAVLFGVNAEIIRSILIKNNIPRRQLKKRLDLRGKVFGRLTAFSIYDKEKWNCICECGNKKKIITDHLVSGHTKSCGCMAKENKLYNNDWEYSARAIWKCRYFDGGLTFEEFYKFSQQNCFYCDERPISLYNKSKYDKRASKKAKLNKYFIYNGLDRLNNDEKHIVENVVSCCKTCNLMKGTMNIFEFFNYIKNVYSFSFLKINPLHIQNKIQHIPVASNLNIGCKIKSNNNYTGMELGNIKITQYIGKDKWECKCYYCNNIFVMWSSVIKKAIKNGRIKQSCGCLNKNNMSYDKCSALRIYKRSYNDGDIDFDKFCELSRLNCYYCNSPPMNVYNIGKK